MKDKLKNLSAATKIGIFLIVTILVLKYIVFPFGESIEKKRALINTLNKKIVSMENLLDNRQKIDSALKKIKANEALVKEKFYKDFKDPQQLQLDLQKKLEGIADKETIRIISVNWLTPLENDLVYAPVQIKCDARPEKIYKMIHQIEREQKFISIDKLVLTAKRDKAQIAADMIVAAWGLNKDQKVGKK